MNVSCVCVLAYGFNIRSKLEEAKEAKANVKASDHHLAITILIFVVLIHIKPITITRLSM